MKKRGGNKRSSANSKAAKRTPAKARKKAGSDRRVKRRAASKSIVSDQQWEIKQSTSVLEQEEKGIRHWINNLTAPQAFHYTSFFVALVMISLLLNSNSLIFYAILTGAVLLFAGFLNRHHRPHHIINILAIFFAPLIVTMGLFRDSFIWLLGIVYLISVVSTIVIYHHQRLVKGMIHDPLKIMWQVVYSKIIAIAVTMILATVLPDILFGPDFIGMFELSLLYLLPLMFVFFFLSKFLYLYFFDRTHVKLDVMKSLHYMLIYTIAFIIVFICMYSIFAVTFYNKQMGSYNEALDVYLYDASALNEVVDAQPAELKQLRVSLELENYLDGYIAELGAEKSRILESGISFGSVLDDSYLSEVGTAQFNKLRFEMTDITLVSAKGRIFDKYQGLSAKEGIESYASAIQTRFEESGFRLESGLTEMFAFMDDPDTTSEQFEEKGIFWMFGQEGDLKELYYPDSMFERATVIVLKHTEFFRTVSTLTLKAMLFMEDQRYSTSFNDMLIINRHEGETPLSKAVRYELILEDINKELQA